MRIGRVVSGVVSCAAVLGCAAVVVSMAEAGQPTSRRSSTPEPVAERTYRPAFVPGSTSASSSPARSSGSVSAPASSASTSSSRTSPAPRTTATAIRTTAAAAPRTTVAARQPARTTAPRTSSAAPRPTTHRVAASGRRLPLGYTTGSATRVITVTAGSPGSTTARLQAWTKVSSGRWKHYGSAITARVGADGIGRASESRSKTPAGSFTITQAFGRRSDPGTRLPYFKTTPSDYWISSAGSKYNTHQRCRSCGYNNGVNERLYYVTPHYNYAAVIDYNTRNAPGGVRAGKGSAFFLHVSVGEATAGCVAIPQDRLVTLLRWLTPSAHPRILIGVT